MPQETDIVYLLDGSSYIHRAYHAIRQLANSKGFPTNAAYGFTQMLLKLIEEKKPMYLAVVFDAKGPVFRHDIYREYKANRPPMPEDLSAQIPVIKSIVKGLNIAAIEMENFEADDIIGTLARVCEEKGMRVIMVTGDKDFRQLITPRVSMLDTMKDKVTEYDAMKSLLGFEPEKYIDVMGLAGDSIDNIPGVPGVGEKTAIQLIRDFGSMDGVFERVEEIKRKKLKENLKTYQEQALLSKRLATIERHVPVEKHPAQLTVREPDREALSNIFREMEFRGLWEKFSSPSEVKGAFDLCLSKAAVIRLKKQIETAGMVVMDIETDSEDPMEAHIVGMAFCCEKGKASYLPLAHHYLGMPSQLDWSDACEILKEVLEAGSIKKVCHNIKFDAEILTRHGVEMGGLFFDTMIASYVINPGLRYHSLDYLAQHYLNIKKTGFSDVVGNGKAPCPFSAVDVEKAMAYACENTDVTLRLMGHLEQKLTSDQNEDLFYDMEMKLVPVLVDMEMTGIKIDTAFLEALSVRYAEQMVEFEKAIFDEAGLSFNINSSQQLGEVLFEKLQLPGQKKTAKTKRYSTDMKVLQKLAAYPHKVPGLVLQYRTLSKLKSTYLDALTRMVDRSTGRVHTSFNQTATATGRLSSSHPNLQNIPVRGKEGREIRKGFVAEEGHCLVSADYSQVELRVFAHYSGDEAFMEAFKSNEDIHSRTAGEIMGVDRQDITPDMRRIAKAINFGIIYGMGARRLSEELNIDFKTAKDYIEAYYERYPGVDRYARAMKEKARSDGYVATLLNRKRYLPHINHGKQRIRAEAERMAVNTPIQGTAADLIKKAMINIHQKLKEGDFRCKMLLQVHDELVFEVPEEELDKVLPLIRQEMEQVYPLDIPLKVDIHVGMNWGELH